MAIQIQPNFSKGEVSPTIYGRVDIPAYKAALRKARNTIVHPFGGISNRAGTVYIGPVKDHTKAPRLIPFQFSTTDAYILEFGDLYMRVIRNNQHVTETVFNITGVTAANPAVVTTSAAHGYSNGDEVFIELAGGMLPVNNRRYLVANVTATTFELTRQVDGTNVDSTLFTAYTSGGTVGKIYEIVTPYAIADVFELNYTQTANVMTVVHPTYQVQEVTRSDHNSWFIAEPAFLPNQAEPTGQIVTVDTAGTETDRYKVTAIGVDGEESLSAFNNSTQTITGATAADPVVITAANAYVNGDEVEIDGVVGMVELNGRRFLASNVTGATFEIQDRDGVDIDGTGFTAYSSGGTSNQTFVRVTTSAVTVDNTITWTAAAGAQKYAVYREDNGLFGLLGETELTTFKDANIAADTVFNPPKYIEVFFFTGDLPGAVGHYEQRRVFGGANLEPDTLEYSKTGLSSNFTHNIPRADDDAITAAITSRQVNQIRHIVPRDDLLVFTSGSEWAIDSGPDTAFTATTLTQREQSTWGSSHRAPIILGDTVLFVQTNNAIVRSFKFSFQVDSWTGSDMGILSAHMLRDNTIKDWDVVKFPDPVIYMVRDDGVMLTLTFDELDDVIAWTTWDTDGKFEAVASLRTALDAQDETGYVVVRRVINGNVVRYIEHTHSRAFADVRDAFFVDSGLSLDNPITITGVTQADPAVVTTAINHGFSNGDDVDIFGIKWEPNINATFTESQPTLADGAPQLNTRRFLVANVTATTFELQSLAAVDVDTTAYNAYIEGGTVRSVSNTVHGFHHLVGETLSALTDGNVVTTMVVAADGSITLPTAASRVHAGMRYISDIETLDVEGDEDDTVQGKDKKVSEVTVRFERTRGLLFGPNEETLTEMKQREFEAMGDPTALLTGDHIQILPPEWNSNGRIFMRQANPLPYTLLAFIPDLEIGD